MSECERVSMNVAGNPVDAHRGVCMVLKPLWEGLISPAGLTKMTLWRSTLARRSVKVPFSPKEERTPLVGIGEHKSKVHCEFKKDSFVFSIADFG